VGSSRWQPESLAQALLSLLWVRGWLWLYRRTAPEMPQHMLVFQAAAEAFGQICSICSYKKAGLGKTVWVMMTTFLSSSRYQQLIFLFYT